MGDGTYLPRKQKQQQQQYASYCNTTARSWWPSTENMQLQKQSQNECECNQGI